jgi:hypothetical protein
VEDGARTFQFDASILCVTTGSTGTAIAGDDSGRLTSWALESGDTQGALDLGRGPIRTVAFEPSKSLVVVGDGAGSISVAFGTVSDTGSSDFARACWTNQLCAFESRSQLRRLRWSRPANQVVGNRSRRAAVATRVSARDTGTRGRSVALLGAGAIAIQRYRVVVNS